MLTVFAQALVPVILLAGLGFVLAKKTDYLSPPQLGQLVSNVGVPALLLNSVLKMEMEASGMLLLIGATVAILASVAIIAGVGLKLAGLPLRFYLPPLVNPNTGNLGIPMAFALFGQEGLAVAVVVSSVVQISHFTLGVGFMSGSYHPKQLLKNGPVIALILGALLLITNITLPAPIMGTLSMLSNITLPIMLMLLGRSLADLTFENRGMLKRAGLLALSRPALGGIVASTLVLFLPLSPVEAATIVMLHTMPVAVISYMLATRYEGPKDEIALMILLSLPVSLIAAGSVWWLAQV
ncbi:AEC family transporter [Maribrevibacterium harenarium]|uniref:AEC family transporter n=1 Tax=Maribrevibacterium harenarium TaxID=2589817 RepID=A0A501X528_9GAMM|nr:AEC family transporter [Maribrevibacterium harenarium]TPE55650.1 AEC family transporter [Maribrevibacterium harenarium]